MFYQSIIRIILSVEKKKYLHELEDENDKLIDNISINTLSSIFINNLNVQDCLFDCFELSFLNQVVKKCVEYYYENFGNKHQTLFRKEESYDELIKTIFNIFGNNYFNNIYCYLDNIINSNSFYIKKDELSDFFDRLLEQIITKTPFILMIIITLIYDEVFNVYKIKSLEPVMVVLFFNYLFNPKIQEFNGYSVLNEKLRDISLIIYKSCFNAKFKNNEKLNSFNDLIEEFNNKLTMSVECIIEKVKQMKDVEVYNMLIKDIYTNGIQQSSWMFYVDCDYIMRVLNEFKLLSNKRRISSTTTNFSSTSSKINIYN